MERATVIGAGVAGLSAALALAGSGFRVTLVEESLFARAASAVSAGILVTILEGPLLETALETVRLARGLGEELVFPVRTLWITRGRGCVERVLREHERVGIRLPPEREDPGGLLEGLQLREGEHAVLIREYILDSGRLLGALHARAVELGVRVVEGRATRRGRRFYCCGRELEPPYVVAAGAWTARLVPEVGDYLVVYRCQLATIEGARPPTVIEDDSLNYYIVPVAPTRSNIGDGANTVIEDPEEGLNPDPEDIYNILERYAERNPSAWDARVLQYWSAPCTTTATGEPILDSVDENIVVYTGFDGAGITLALGASMHVPRVLRGDPPPGWLALREDKKGPRAPVEPYNLCG